MTDEENALHMAALDGLLHIAGKNDLKAVARLLRSQYEISSLVRNTLAGLIEDGRVRLSASKAGPKRTLTEALASQAQRHAIAGYVRGRMASGLPQKAAVADAVAEFGVSGRTISKALQWERAWRKQAATLLGDEAN